MKDRNVQFPNRFEIVAVPGTTNIFDVTPAPGEVYEEGTFWNKQNVLQDATAALYGKGSNASPDEIFAAIKPLISAAQNTADGKTNSFFGKYTGTGKYGSGNENSLTFPFPPKILFIGPEQNTRGIIATILCETNAGIVVWVGNTLLRKINVTIQNNTISWWSTENNTVQLNESLVYKYVAIG